MNRSARIFSKLAITALLLAFLGVFQGAAQEEVNLLTNPGFESPFVNQGGDPVRLVAQGWEPWHIERQNDGTEPAWQNRQPVYEPAAPDETRVRSGDNAQLYYNDTWWAHDGGVYQRVTDIDPGTELRFSVYAYVWSSTFDDREVSEEDGDVTVEVGIDPTGGTDPTSNNIVWSFAVEQYDAYRQYSIIAASADDAVTVWVRSRVGFPVQNTYIYLDDAVLAETVSTVIETDTPAPTETEAPEPTNTPIPIETDQPTNTPEPTNTAQPTNTPQPTNTSVPGEDPTPTREGPDPTNTPQPTNTLQPTNTAPGAVETVPPEPTSTPAPTNTPVDAADGVDNGDRFLSTLTYTIRSGDTVGRIAALYGSTVEAINRANDLGEENLIFVGQRLIIPIPLPAPATSTPTPTFTPSPTPPVTATPDIIVVTPPPGVVTSVYVVQPGDTLSGIARRFNTTAIAIAQANGITNVNRIFAGQRLVIPVPGSVAVQPPPPPAPTPVPPRTYTVQPGDNLYRISLRFGVTMRQLAQANNITNVNFIFAGQQLVIP
ncbi:MAG: LysM peptidoglycan-binding domain-containing protein [Chloroflexota bacterium]